MCDIKKKHTWQHVEFLFRVYINSSDPTVTEIRGSLFADLGIARISESLGKILSSSKRFPGY